MVRLVLFAVVMTTYIAYTRALSCPQCTYLDLPQEVKDAGISSAFDMFGSDEKCKTGSSTIYKDGCGSPKAGHKMACTNAKAEITTKVTISGQSVDMGLTFFTRSCNDIDSTKHPEDKGSTDIEQYKDDIDDMFRDISNNGVSGLQLSITVEDVSGGMTYCTTSGCGATDDISDLSGVSLSAVPSALLLGVLALVATLLSV